MGRDALMSRMTAMVIVAAGIAACAGEDAVVETEEIEEVRVEGPTADTLLLPPAELARARETATALAQDLAGLVFSTLESRGPVAAVEVCSEVAQERTASFATDGVYVRRITDRLRNPLNAPDAAEARELDRMRALDDEGRLSGDIIRLVRAGDQTTLHLVRPIRTQAPCLTCHGDVATIPEDVRAILDERYPEDRATGYREGEFRGAISVRVPVR